MPSLTNVLSPVSNFGGSSKGPTADQNQILSSQKSFMNTLQQSFGTAFAGQQNIINGLTKSLQQTLSAGPSQFGFSAPEVSALNTLVTTSNAQAYQNARAAAGEAAAATGQGGATLPSGAQNEQIANLALKAGENESNQLLGIQEAGYKQGVQNYNESVSGLTSAASLENPSGYASAANSAGENAAGEANVIQKINAQNNPWGQVGGLVGSLASAALGAATGGASLPFTGALSGIGALAKAGNQQLSTDLSGGPSYDSSADNYQLPYPTNSSNLQ